MDEYRKTQAERFARKTQQKRRQWSDMMYKVAVAKTETRRAMLLDLWLGGVPADVNAAYARCQILNRFVATIKRNHPPRRSIPITYYFRHNGIMDLRRLSCQTKKLWREKYTFGAKAVDRCQKLLNLHREVESQQLGLLDSTFKLEDAPKVYHLSSVTSDRADVVWLNIEDYNHWFDLHREQHFPLLLAIKKKEALPSIVICTPLPNVNVKKGQIALSESVASRLSGARFSTIRLQRVLKINLASSVKILHVEAYDYDATYDGISSRISDPERLRVFFQQLLQYDSFKMERRTVINIGDDLYHPEHGRFLVTCIKSEVCVGVHADVPFAGLVGDLDIEFEIGHGGLVNTQVLRDAIVHRVVGQVMGRLGRLGRCATSDEIIVHINALFKSIERRDNRAFDVLSFKDETRLLTTLAVDMMTRDRPTTIGSGLLPCIADANS